MKLLMTVDAVGGVWTYALELSRALAPHGVQVVLACMGPRPNASQRESARALPNVKLACAGYKLEWMAEPWGDVARAGDWLLRLADRERIDLVHLNGYVHAALPWERPVVVVAHSCVYSWWQAVHRCEPPHEWQPYRERVAEGLAHADCIVAPTAAYLDSIRDIYRPTRPALVIHNARSIVTGGVQPQRPPIVFAAGRIWDRAKGVDVLDAAAHDLPWHTYVAGATDGPDGGSAQLNAVRCLGVLRAQDQFAWLRRTSIFAHAARYEPFGLAVLEAALSGCALVLSDLPTLRELWHGAALFFPADDAQALHRALRALIADPERLADLADAAFGRAQRYQPQSMAAQYYDLYAELLTRTSRQECEVA